MGLQCQFHSIISTDISKEQKFSVKYSDLEGAVTSKDVKSIKFSIKKKFI